MVMMMMMINNHTSNNTNKRVVGTECELRALEGSFCGASFDWKCSGICSAPVRMFDVHQRCGEGDNAIWTSSSTF